MTRATPIYLIATLSLIAQLIASLPAAAQAYGEPPAPTAQDADPGVDHTALVTELPPEFRRTSVFYRTSYPLGTIIVNTADRFLYLIMGNNVAMRYGIGVGRAGFQWGGVHVITRKAEWPDWRPPSEMIARANPTCRASWPAVPAIRSARARFTLARPTIESTAQTRRRRSVRRYRRAVSAWSTTMSSTSMPASRSAPRSWCSISRGRRRANCVRYAALWPA
jgi:hypothetical protein